MTPVQKLPYKLYPLNKSSTGTYSYSNGSPILTFKFAQQDQRVLKSSSLFLCGRMKIKNKNKSNLPANRFDLYGSASADAEAYEEVAYIDDTIG